MGNFLIAKATDVGMQRQVNEDSITVFESPNGQVMAVCDGMGGQAAGDVASQLAVSIIESILTDNTFDSPDDAIKRSVLAANQGLLNQVAQNPDLEGMGSTCVMLIIKNGQVYCGWVGDSRIYYISNHTIRQISHDQSVVQKLVDQGVITSSEALVHPQKNEIDNAIGLPGMLAPDTIPVPITPAPGSVFLLCSDGLTGMVSDAQIERVVSNTKMSLQQKADRLIEMANEAGGPDNITVGLVQFGAPDSEGVTSGTMFNGPAQPKSKKNNTKFYLFIALCCLLCIAATAAFLLMDSGEKQEADRQPAKTEQGKTKAPSGKAEQKVEEKKEEPAPKPAPQTTSKSRNQNPSSGKGKKRGASDIENGFRNGKNNRGKTAEDLIEKKEDKPLDDVEHFNGRGDKDYN